MRRWGAGLLCALQLVLLLAGLAWAAGEDAVSGGAVINAYDARFTVGADGRAQATVDLDMTIDTPLTVLDFPIGSGSGGEIAGLETTRVKTGEGTSLRLESEAGISGERHFTITYEVSAIAESDEGQLLTLDLIAPGWTWPMDEASFEVTMPAAYTEGPVYEGGYYGDLVEDKLDLTQSTQAFSGASTEALRDHDSLRVTLALPADYVDLKLAGGISERTALIAVAVLAALAVFYWYRTLYSRRGPVRMRPTPPDGAGAGDLPMLYTCDAPSLPLQTMQWASMGYLAIHLGRRGHIVLRQTMTMGTERRKQERAVFAMLFSREGWCDGESGRLGQLAERYAHAMRAWWERRLFSRGSGSPLLLKLISALAAGAAALGSASAGLPAERLRGVFLALAAVLGFAAGLVVQRGVLEAARRRAGWGVAGALTLAVLLAAARAMGGLFAMALALGLQVFAALATLRGGRRSRAGRESLSQVLGFRRFLQHVNQHQLVTRLRDDSQYFYKLLPYAEALGLGSEFADRFGEIVMEPCAWMETDGRPARTGPAFYARFREVLRRMENAPH